VSYIVISTVASTSSNSSADGGELYSNARPDRSELAFVMCFQPVLATFANPALMQPICGDDLHAALSGAGVFALRAELVSRLS
jgi:hypothetical protein